MSEFLKNYLEEFSILLEKSNKQIDQLNEVKEAVVSASRKGNKIIIVGNGGSAAIASHFSVDLTKNAGIRCINFNEADLITCFSNDYGFERYMEKAVDFYGDKGDLLIVISSSGSSENILNAVKAARRGNFKAVVTLSGFAKDSPLRKLGDINLWVNSKAYNFVENIHQVWLLAVVDMIIGKAEYLANPDES